MNVVIAIGLVVIGFITGFFFAALLAAAKRGSDD